MLAEQSLRDAQAGLNELLTQLAGHSPGPGAKAFHFEALPSTLASRLMHDGIDPQAALTRAEREIDSIRRSQKLQSIATKPPPLTPLIADYRSLDLHDIDELVLALRGQSALPRHSTGPLERDLEAVQARCTAERAVAMIKFKRDLVKELAPSYRAFMQVALAPLLTSRPPSLAQLPQMPHCTAG